MRREKTDGVVAPVISQSAFDEQRIVDELMDRQKLDRRHPKRAEMFDRGRMRKRSESSAKIFGNLRMPFREAFDVQLVDHRLVPRRARIAIVSPVEIRIGDDGVWHERHAVDLVYRVLALI